MNRRSFLKQTSTAALAAAVLPALRALPMIAAAPTPLEQCGAYRAELEGMGVAVRLVPETSCSTIAINFHHRGTGLRMTGFPAEAWGTADGAELLRQSVEHHQQPLSEWPQQSA